MGKTKVTDKSSKKDKKVESVKAGRVTKPAQTSKAKSKDIAKSAVKKEKKSKKAKTPTPEPESDTESSASEEDDDDSSSSEDEKVEPKVSAKVASKAAAKDDSDSDDSSDDSESDEEEKPVAKANGVKTNGAAKATKKDDSSDSESDSDSSESEAEKPAAKAEKADSSDSDADSDSDDSESEKEEAPSKKRKAETAAEPVVKKTKTEAPAADEGIKNLFVGSLSWNIDEDWLRRSFEGFGEIVGCRVISDRETGRSKGFGYVEFANAADAAKAQKEMHESELDGRNLNVDFSTPREKPDQNARANKFGDQRSAPAPTLFLGNLSFDCTNDGIQEIFAEYGNITRVSLPTDRESGSLKGFGYVDFSSTEEATAALQALNGQEIEGRAIRIDYAAPRADNGGGFGGGRGGGRGGFGDRGGRGGRGGGRGGFGDRGGRGGGRGRGGDRGGRGRGGFGTNRGGFGDFQGQKKSFD